jgi:hypothetical protein
MRTALHHGITAGVETTAGYSVPPRVRAAAAAASTLLSQGVAGAAVRHLDVLVGDWQGTEACLCCFKQCAWNHSVHGRWFVIG